MRYRLDVVAPSVAEAVRYAGGWMFDRVMAGWDVNVLLAESGDVRPLKILGAEPVDFESVVAAGDDQPHPQALAVAADLIDRDERVRKGVLRAIDHGMTEVAVWGEGRPAGLDRGVDSVQHRLSSAARVFKAQALAAAAVTDVAGRSGRHVPQRRDDLLARSAPTWSRPAELFDDRDRLPRALPHGVADLRPRSPGSPRRTGRAGSPARRARTPPG